MTNQVQNKWKNKGKATTNDIHNKKRKSVKLKSNICWIDDYSKEICINPVGRYANQYDKLGQLKSMYFGEKKYKISIPIKSNGELTVEVRFKVIAKLSGAELTNDEKKSKKIDDLSSAKTKLIDGINKFWNNRFSINIIDPLCGKKIYPIKYIAKWVETDEHYKMIVHDSYPREGVTGLRLDVSNSTTDWVYAHEFGHCLGLPDEYSYTADTETVKYYKPDRSLGAPISAPPDGKDAAASDATIMAAYGCTKTKKRHAWNIAIEARDLLSEKIGRAIKCEIL